MMQVALTTGRILVLSSSPMSTRRAWYRVVLLALSVSASSQAWADDGAALELEGFTMYPARYFMRDTPLNGQEQEMGFASNARLVLLYIDAIPGQKVGPQ